MVEEAKKEAEGSAARALQTLRLRAITGSRSEEAAERDHHLDKRYQKGIDIYILI